MTSSSTASNAPPSARSNPVEASEAWVRRMPCSSRKWPNISASRMSSSIASSSSMQLPSLAHPTLGHVGVFAVAVAEALPALAVQFREMHALLGRQHVGGVRERGHQELRGAFDRSPALPAD